MSRYAVVRHEDSLGNTAESLFGLYKHIIRTGDTSPKVFVEHQWQKDFALCIPLLKPEDIHFFPKEWTFPEIVSNTDKADILISSAYRANKSFPGVWKDLQIEPDCTFKFPYEQYENVYNLPSDAIVMQVREPTFHKRHVGANEEPERFVDPDTFFQLAEHYANAGHTVVRIGDPKQKPFPKHKNIIDFPMDYEKRTILDDLYMIDKSKVFVSCDSGIWPMAGGMKKKLVLSNVASVFHPPAMSGDNLIVRKAAIVNWLQRDITRVLFKQPSTSSGRLELMDNTFEIIKQATDSLLVTK